MATMAQTLKQLNRKVKELKTKVSPYIVKAQKTFDTVFPPPKRSR